MAVTSLSVSLPSVRYEPCALASRVATPPHRRVRWRETSRAGIGMRSTGDYRPFRGPGFCASEHWLHGRDAPEHGPNLRMRLTWAVIHQ